MSSPVLWLLPVKSIRFYNPVSVIWTPEFHTHFYWSNILYQVLVPLHLESSTASASWTLCAQGYCHAGTCLGLFPRICGSSTHGLRWPGVHNLLAVCMSASIYPSSRRNPKSQRTYWSLVRSAQSVRIVRMDAGSRAAQFPCPSRRATYEPAQHR